jgi:pimeloyl-ACP methyl ester carboxylesterase
MKRRAAIEEDTYACAALRQYLAGEQEHLIGANTGGEICLLMAALRPEIARSVATCVAAGTLSDPCGHLREVIKSVMDHPLPPFQQFRDYLVATYGEVNFRFGLYHMDRTRRPKPLTYQVAFDPEKAREEEDKGNETMNEP